MGTSEEDYKKIKKLADLRKMRADKAYRAYQNKVSELNHHEDVMKQMRFDMDRFLQDRHIQIQTLQNRMRTEAVSGRLIETYLNMQEDTQTQSNKKFNEIEEKSRMYYQLLKDVEKNHKEYDDVNRSKSKLERIAEKKFEIVKEEREMAEEEALYDIDFRKKQYED